MININRLYFVLCVKVFTAYLCGATSDFAQEARVPDVDKYIWDLKPAYPDETTWQKERNTLQEAIRGIGKLKGGLGRSAKALADGLDAIYDLRARAAKMAIYGTLLHEVNNISADAQTKYDVGNTIEAQVESAVAFMGIEIPSIGKEKISQWIKMEPRLERHRQRINRILREASHVASEETQSVIESVTRWPRMFGDIYDQLRLQDLGWVVVKNSSGDSIVADPDQYGSARRRGNVRDKQIIDKAFLSKIKTLENVFGTIYTNRIFADLTIARSRKFDDGIEAIWFLREGYPKNSPNLVIEAVRSYKTEMIRYLKLRNTLLGITGLNYGNLQIPLPPSQRAYTVAEAMNIARNALSPLGKTYADALDKKMKNPFWMHLAPTPNKNGTYAIFPPVGDMPAYFMQTYRGSTASVGSFTAAMTFMMYYEGVASEKKPDTRDDPAIYGNGLIYISRLLNDEYVRSNIQDKQERLFNLMNTIDFIWKRLMYYTVFIELDQQVQSKIIHGETPSGGEISQMYLELLRRYYGHYDGGVVVDESYGAEWMIEPVPFSTYELEFWPPAMVVGCSAFQKIKEGNERVKNMMFKAWGSCETNLSHDLLLSGGIDLTTKAPYQTALKMMSALLDELETSLKNN